MTTQPITDVADALRDRGRSDRCVSDTIRIWKMLVRFLKIDLRNEKQNNLPLNIQRNALRSAWFALLRSKKWRAGYVVQVRSSLRRALDVINPEQRNAFDVLVSRDLTTYVIISTNNDTHCRLHC